MNELTEETAERIGNELVSLLGLRPLVDGNVPRRYYTSWGSKTVVGLARTVHRVFTTEKENEREQIVPS